MPDRYRQDEEDMEAKVKSGLKRWGVAAGLGLAAILGFSLSYRSVAPQNLGVITRLGQYEQTVQAGPHLIIPIIEGMKQVDVTTNQSVEIGFRTIKEATNGQGATYREVMNDQGQIDEGMKAESQMLTADENIIWQSLVVQYKVNPLKVTDYLFNVQDQVGTIRNASEAALRQVVGNYGVDEVITTGRVEIQDQIKTELQRLLDEYDLGVDVQGVFLQATQPPNLTGSQGGGTVADAFRGVETARQSKDARINDATAYSNKVTTEAQGEASQIIANAEGTKATRIGQAQRDVGEFNLLLQQYLLDPVGTKNRLYLETMEAIYPNIDKIIIDSSVGGNGILPLLNLNGGN